MPFFSYRCTACGEEFETLVRSGETPECPKCRGTSLERLLAAPMVAGKTEAALQGIRARAAKEGHFSNYSRSELKRR